MTDKTAIDCAEALIQFCNDRDCVCDGCVFRKNKHDGSGEWGCNIGEIVFRDVYDANEVWENYKSATRHRGAKMEDEETRKRGTWKKFCLNGQKYYECSKCRRAYPIKHLTCPNCKTRMALYLKTNGTEDEK